MERINEEEQFARERERTLKKHLGRADAILEICSCEYILPLMQAEQIIMDELKDLKKLKP